MEVFFVAGSGGTGGTAAGFSDVLYVDVNGNDATAQRGNLARKFKTIEAAMAAMQDGDQIDIGPGTWTPAVTLTLPANFTQFSFAGSGRDTTRIVMPNNVDFFNLSARGHALAAAQFFGFTALCSGTGRGLVGSGAGANGAWLQPTDPVGLIGGLALNIMTIECAAGVRALDLSYVNQIQSDDLLIGGNSNFTSCGFMTFLVPEFWGDVFNTYSSADPQAATFGASTFDLHAGYINGIYHWGGQSSLSTGTQGGGSYILGGIQGNALVVAGGLSPQLLLHRTALGPIDLNTAGRQLPDSALPMVDLRGCALVQGASVAISVVGGAVNRQRVQMQGVSAFDAAAFTAGNNVDLDLRGSTIQQVELSVVGNGTIDRDRHRVPAQALALLGTAVPIAPPFPAGTSYDVMIEAAAPGVTVGITAKTPTGFTATPSVAATVNIDAVRAP